MPSARAGTDRSEAFTPPDVSGIAWAASVVVAPRSACKRMAPRGWPDPSIIPSAAAAAERVPVQVRLSMSAASARPIGTDRPITSSRDASHGHACIRRPNAARRLARWPRAVAASTCPSTARCGRSLTPTRTPCVAPRLAGSEAVTVTVAEPCATGVSVNPAPAAEASTTPVSFDLAP